MSAPVVMIEGKPMRRRTIRVTYADGNTVETWINGTRREIRQHYIGKFFQFGDTAAHPKDKMVKAVSVRFLN
jgi:hypothetical protein